MTGFMLGFLGPILYGLVTREGSAQGPMLGIFITGPLGLALGMLVGTIKWIYSDNNNSIRDGDSKGWD